MSPETGPDRGEPTDPEAIDPEAIDPEAIDPEALDPEAVHVGTDAPEVEAGVPGPGTDVPEPDAAVEPSGDDDGGDDVGDDDGGDDAAPEPAVRRGRRRDPLAAVLIGVLTLLLGFAFAVQVRSTDADDQLSGAREEDLVRILDDLTAQEDRLRQEIADQRTALDSLGSSDSASAAALAEAQQRASALEILNGTAAAQGPGITMTVRDPEGRVTSSTLLNAIEELRGAGAETMQVDDVRVGVSSAVTGQPGDLRIDGQALDAPYTFVVIGSPQDMATAMSIPGGVVGTVGGKGGSVDIVQGERVVVDALRPLDEPQYAVPDGK